MKKAIDTDHAILSRSVEREFNEQCDLVEPGHKLFRAFEGRHFMVELHGSHERTILSVRRIAWALAHPQDHVAADEEVWTTCEHKGSSSTGEGSCVSPDHLKKGKQGDSRREARA